MAEKLEAQKIADLVTLWKKRTKKRFNDVIIQVNTELETGFTENMFNPRYRKGERNSVYPVDEVFAVFKAFHYVDEPTLANTALELVLLAFWTNTGRELIRKGRKLFPEHELRIVLEWYTFEAPEDFDYFDLAQQAEAYQYIEKLKDTQKQGGAKFSPSHNPPQYVLLSPERLDKVRITTRAVEQASQEANTLKIARQKIWAGKYTEAQQLLRPLVETKNTTSKSKRGIAVEALSLLSVSCLHQGDHDGASVHLDQAKGLASGLDSQFLAKLEANVGATYLQLGDAVNANFHLKDSYAIAAECDDQIVMLYSKIGMGITSGEMLDYQRAEQHYQDALSLANRIHLPEREAFLHLNQGILRFYQKRYQEAENLYTAVSRYLEYDTNPLMQGLLLWNKANLHIAQHKDNDQINAMIRHASAIAKEFDFGWLSTALAIEQATINLKSNRIDEARQGFDQAFFQATQVKDTELAVRALMGWGLSEFVRDFHSSTHEEAILLWLNKALPINFREKMCQLSLSSTLPFTKASLRYKQLLGKPFNDIDLGTSLRQILSIGH